MMRQKGLTLIELMVSITIGLVVVGGLLYVYVGTRGAYRTSKSTSRIQEAGRFGLDSILRDVRQAGFIGCGSRVSLGALSPGGAPAFAPVAVNQIAVPPLTFASAADAVHGYSPSMTPPAGSNGWTPPPGTGDLLELRVIMAAPVQMVRDPDPAIPAIYLSNNCARVATGNYMMVSSCSNATVLRVSNKPDISAKSCPANGVVAGGVEVDFGTTDANGNTVNANPNGGTPTLVNPTKPGNLNTSSQASAEQFDDVVYYVAQYPGRPAKALYRYSTATSLATGLPTAEEIIDHVENMCVVYGVGGGANVAFKRADEVDAGNLWPSVVSVRIYLMAVGDEAGAIDTPQTLNWCQASGSTAPTTIAGADTRLRQVFTSTAALRDRLQ